MFAQTFFLLKKLVSVCYAIYAEDGDDDEVGTSQSHSNQHI